MNGQMQGRPASPVGDESLWMGNKPSTYVKHEGGGLSSEKRHLEIN